MIDVFFFMLAAVLPKKSKHYAVMIVLVDYLAVHPEDRDAILKVNFIRWLDIKDAA